MPHTTLVKNIYSSIFSSNQYKLTWKAETGTERVCLKSSLPWAIEWIEEQLDSFESVRRNIPLGSKANEKKNIIQKLINLWYY